MWITLGGIQDGCKKNRTKGKAGIKKKVEGEEHQTRGTAKRLE